MWAAALKTYQDESTRYVFFPELLAKADEEKIRADLVKYGLALQPNKHVHIWTTIARTLHEFYQDDPREIIAEAETDAGELIKLLQVAHRKRFPYLSGPKLSNYWPFILSLYTDVQFKHPEEISIIPDTHVLQSSAQLGLVTAGSTPVQVETAWKALLKDSGINPSQVHPVLWNWSRNGFQPTV
jgi:endonuclease III